MRFLTSLFNRFSTRGGCQRDKERTRLAYQSLNEVRLEALGSICGRLFQPEITATQLQTELDALMKALLQLQYSCRGFGGSRIRLADQTPKRVPRHIARLFRLYQEKVVPMQNNHKPDMKLSEAVKRGLLLRFRNTVFSIIAEAAAHPPMLCCGLFSLRDTETTQATYNTMADYSRGVTTKV